MAGRTKTGPFELPSLVGMAGCPHPGLCELPSLVGTAGRTKTGAGLGRAARV